MKILKLTILSLAVFVLAAIIFSCSKQNNMEPVSSTSETSLSNTDILIENKIRAFKSKMEYQRENPGYKSGETMSADSAVWYFTAALNYTYARADYEIERIISDSAKIVIPSTGEDLFLEDIPVIYQQLLDSLSEKYNAIQSENKNLIMVNLMADEPTANGTELTIYTATGEVMWDIATGIGYEYRYHIVRFTYGEKHISPNPAETL